MKPLNNGNKNKFYIHRNLVNLLVQQITATEWSMNPFSIQPLWLLPVRSFFRTHFLTVSVAYWVDILFFLNVKIKPLNETNIESINERNSNFKNWSNLVSRLVFNLFLLKPICPWIGPVITGVGKVKNSNNNDFSFNFDFNHYYVYFQISPAKSNVEIKFLVGQIWSNFGKN